MIAHEAQERRVVGRCCRLRRAGWLALSAALAIGANPLSAQPTPQRFDGWVENRGQWSTEARFVADFGDLLVRAEVGAIAIQKTVLTDGRAVTSVVRMVLEGAEQVEPRGGEHASGSFHYFIGQDPAAWRTDVAAFRDVTYTIAEGAEVTLYEKDGHLEYDVRLSRSASIESVALRCEGITGMTLGPDGSLQLETLLGAMRQSAPIAHQIRPGGRWGSVACTFRILDDERFGFAAPHRAEDSTLLIDPGITWSTFLGGSAGDWSTCVDSRSDGRIVVVGPTSSSNFPVTAGVFSETFSGPADVSVTCMEASGDALVYSTFIGGAEGDVPRAMALAADGTVAIVGHTTSTDYPASRGSFDATFGGIQDGFLSLLSSDGSELLLSTYLGGTCGDSLMGVAFGPTGLVITAGGSCSSDFPTTAMAYDRSFNGPLGADAVVAALDALQIGTAQLVYSTFLGGGGSENINDLVLSSAGEPVVVGEKNSSPGFPTTPGAYSQTDSTGFISRFASDGSALIASTHFPGKIYCVARDDQDIVIAGEPSTGFPVFAGSYDPTPNGSFTDCFVARIDGQLSQVSASTYLGGSLHDLPNGLALDPSGGIVLVGSTGSLDYPTTMGAFDVDKGGFAGSLVSMVSYLSADVSELLYSSFLGPSGSTSSWANDVVALGVADAVIVGQGALTGFPVTPGAFDETFNGGSLGGGDGYVTRMQLEPAWVSLGGAILGSNGTPTLIGSGPLWGGQPVTLALSGAKPSTAVTLVLGLSQLGAPFKGGTLWPSPDLLIAGLVTTTHGLLSLGAIWPAGLPPGFTFTTQIWIPDAAGPAGFAASNGLLATTP